MRLLKKIKSKTSELLFTIKTKFLETLKKDKTRIVNFRGFLSRNMPFFDFFQKVLVGLVAGIIGYTQLKTSNEQLDIRRKELLPNFRVKYLNSSQYIDKENKSDSLIVRISNIGKTVENFNCDIDVFLKVKVRSLKINVNLKSEELLIPIIGDFDKNEYYNLSSPFYIKTYFDLKSIEKRFNEILKTRDFVLSVSVVNLFRIGYDDIFSTDNSAYFIDTRRVFYEEYLDRRTEGYINYKRKLYVNAIPESVIKGLISNDNLNSRPMPVQEKGGDGPGSAEGGG